MANYHCTTKLISRGQGRSGVQFLAYCADAVLIDRRLNETFLRAEQTGDIHVEIGIPENVTPWISDIVEELKTDKSSALQKLSDIIEESETRKDSQIYRELEISLPDELSRDENIISCVCRILNTFKKCKVKHHRNLSFKKIYMRAYVLYCNTAQVLLYRVNYQINFWGNSINGKLSLHNKTHITGTGEKWRSISCLLCGCDFD